MTIHIEELSISTIIGILDFERITPQNILINIKIDYPYKNNNFINYAEVIQIVEKRIIEKKYELLEDALKDIKKILFKSYPQMLRFYLKIAKPDIISNAQVALSIEENLC